MPEGQTPAGDRPTVELAQLGGEEGIARWVTRFYEAVAVEPLLAPMFEDLERARTRQLDYFVEFFGGPKRYTERHGRAFLRFKHRNFRIGPPEREAWMRLVIDSLRAVVSDEAVVAAVERKLGPIADAMINHRPDQHDPYYFQR